MKICVVGDVLDVITCAKFQNKIFRGYDFTGGRIFLFPIDFEWALQQCSATALPVIWPFSDFSRWQLSDILDLLYVYLDHPQRVLHCLYHCAKFGWNQCSSLDDMPVLMFCKFGLKMSFHAPSWVVYGDLTP